MCMQNKTVGIIGAGRIGAAYARMFAEGHKMDVVYYDPYPNKRLESFIADYGKLLESKGERAVTIKQLPTVEDVLKHADVSITLSKPYHKSETFFWWRLSHIDERSPRSGVI